MRNHFPNHGVIPQPPSLQEIHYPTRHSPYQTKTTKEGIPQDLGALTMGKQMINGFLIPFAHPTPIDQHHVLLSQVVYREYLAKGSQPNEECHPRRGFSKSNTLPRKRAASCRNNLLVEGSHLKLPLSTWNPPNLVNPTIQVKGIK